MATVTSAFAIEFLISEVFRLAQQLFESIENYSTNAQNLEFFKQRLEFILSLKDHLERFRQDADQTKEKTERSKQLSLLNTKLMALQTLLEETGNVFDCKDNKKKRSLRMFFRAVELQDIQADIDPRRPPSASQIDLRYIKRMLEEAQREEKKAAKKKAADPINIDQITEEVNGIYQRDPEHSQWQALLKGYINQIAESDITMGLIDGTTFTLRRCTLYGKEDCVLKTPTSSIVTPAELSSLIREAKVLQHLYEQPYVVGFKGITSIKGRSAIVLERCTAGTIHQFNGQTVAIGWDVKLSLKLQLAYTLECMHNMGTCHSDLRPSNVLVTEVDGKPEIRIIDFNHASSTAVMTIAHSHNVQVRDQWNLYLLPETGSVEAFGKSSDVYQAGVIF
ncbi:hypothetical protein HK102_006931 [Quaeritorhiza haematococci]|nr:hypothetical protein HK102_006931 [Quaeritorhiza haematococci]